MWRTALSVLLSAILGSVVATVIYAFWFSIWQGEPVAKSLQDLRLLFAISFAASWFTVPGAMLLSGVEFALSETIQSERKLDAAIVAFGAFAGAAILGGLARNALPQFALVGGFYGLTTAILFVLFQRQLGSRRERAT